MRVELELAGIRHVVGDQKSAPTSKANSPRNVKKDDGSNKTSLKGQNFMPLIPMASAQSLPSLSMDVSSPRNYLTRKSSPSPRKMQTSPST